MSKFISVECFADKYFFSKLIGSEYINKQANKPKAIANILRNSHKFEVGIIDEDKVKLKDNKQIKNQKVEFEWILQNDYFEVGRIKDKNQVFIQLIPEFEPWISKVLKNYFNKDIQDFGFADLKDFNSIKGINQNKDKRFVSLVKFILENYSTTDNPVKKLKQILDEIQTNPYNIDKQKITDFI